MIFIASKLQSQELEQHPFHSHQFDFATRFASDVLRANQIDEIL